MCNPQGTFVTPTFDVVAHEIRRECDSTRVRPGPAGYSIRGASIFGGEIKMGTRTESAITPAIT